MGLVGDVVTADERRRERRRRQIRQWKRNRRALYRRVLERDGHRCVLCGATDHLTLDHIVPKSKGGPRTEHNFRTLCKPCNQAKGAKLPRTGGEWPDALTAYYARRGPAVKWAEA